LCDDWVNALCEGAFPRLLRNGAAKKPRRRLSESAT
jgi:hypothetical protein